MAYTTTALGMKLADPNTVQAFETTVVNDNFLTLEGGIMAPEQVTAVSDLPATGNWLGRRMFVSAVNGTFRWNGTKWTLAEISGSLAHAATNASSSGGLYWSVDFTSAFLTAFDAVPSYVGLSASTPDVIQWAVLQTVNKGDFHFRIVRLGSAVSAGTLFWTAKA